jgi:hypothetical protein
MRLDDKALMAEVQQSEHKQRSPGLMPGRALYAASCLIGRTLRHRLSGSCSARLGNLGLGQPASVRIDFKCGLA